MVTYSDDRKYAYVDGLRFCRDEKTGYYLNSVLHKRLHRYVYESVYGEIPDGYQVHHTDHDKNNNEPDNLELLTKSEHMQRHGNELSEEERQRRRNNMIANAIPAAASWHGSDIGRAWHKHHYEITGESLHSRIKRICKQCGETFDGTQNTKNAFCSNACKSAWRRQSGIDNQERKCIVCGSQFTVNKYAKTLCCSNSCASRLAYMNREARE
jgi:hypothetical protein